MRSPGQRRAWRVNNTAGKQTGAVQAMQAMQAMHKTRQNN